MTRDPTAAMSAPSKPKVSFKITLTSDKTLPFKTCGPVPAIVIRSTIHFVLCLFLARLSVPEDTQFTFVLKFAAEEVGCTVSVESILIF